MIKDFETKEPTNPLSAELNPTYHLLALLGAHHIIHVSRIRVKRETVEEESVVFFEIVRKSK